MKINEDLLPSKKFTTIGRTSNYDIPEVTGLQGQTVLADRGNLCSISSSDSSIIKISNNIKPMGIKIHYTQLMYTYDDRISNNMFSYLFHNNTEVADGNCSLLTQNERGLIVLDLIRGVNPGDTFSIKTGGARTGEYIAGVGTYGRTFITFEEI